MTHLIGAHPDALAYRPFNFEPRMLDYWLEIVHTASHPHSYAQAIHPDVNQERAWWEGRARWLGPLFLDADPAVGRWVETEAIEEFAAFAQRRVDSFYARVAESQDKPQACGSWSAATSGTRWSWRVSCTRRSRTGVSGARPA